MDSNLERQAAELTLLTTMYPAEFTWRTSPPPNLSEPEPSFANPSFALTLHPSYTLEITLPETYPSTSKPTAYLACGGDIPTQTRKQARTALANVVSTQDPGVEVLDLIVTSFQEILHSFVPDSEDAGTQEANTTSIDTNPTKSETIKRIVIWSHHLLATSKRRDIQAWSKELNLGGFARPGHPGSIFVEGCEDQVDEFVRRIKQLRWQALQVRGEETATSRICTADGVVEVEGLGEIAERLKVLDSETATLFLQAMKITKTD